MKKVERKEIINHFIKFFIYDENIGVKYNNSDFTRMELSIIEKNLLRFLKPYIKDEHYNFNPFTEIREGKK